MKEHERRCLNIQYTNICRYVNVTWCSSLNVIVCSAYTDVHVYVPYMCLCGCVRVCPFTVHAPRKMPLLDPVMLLFIISLRCWVRSWSLFWWWIVYRLHTFCGTSLPSTLPRIIFYKPQMTAVNLLIFCCGFFTCRWQESKVTMKAVTEVEVLKLKIVSISPGWQYATCLLAALHSGLRRLSRSSLSFFYNGFLSVWLLNVGVKGQLMILMLFDCEVLAQEPAIYCRCFTLENIYLHLSQKKKQGNRPRNACTAFNSGKSV